MMSGETAHNILVDPDFRALARWKRTIGIPVAVGVILLSLSGRCRSPRRSSSVKYYERTSASGRSSPGPSLRDWQPHHKEAA